MLRRSRIEAFVLVWILYIVSYRVKPSLSYTQSIMPSFVEQAPLDAIVIGAGFGGCYLLRNLRKHGFKVKVFEEGLGLGGVWYHNTYPGARVDTDVPFYEYSDPELWSEWQWTEQYPSQPELRTYFEFVDSKWCLSRDITFGARVTVASFDTLRNEWTVATDKGHTATARFLIPSMGFASKLYIPQLPGLETFKGFACHTAKWPGTAPDFTGKRVGVMGTGATGVQVVQELGPVAGQMVVFQRSPNCALPMRQKVSAVERRDTAGFPELFKQMKKTSSGFTFPVNSRKAMEDTPDQQRAMFERLWETGGFILTYGNYSDFMTNLEANHLFYRFWRDKVRERLTTTDPEMIESLAPWDPPYPFSTKRPSLEQRYYEVFNQDNVRLVALKKNPIVEIVPTGARMADGTVIELDALIFATGFDAVTGSFSRVNFRGLKNKTLDGEWSGGTRTFLGMSTSGFPNMLYLYGPQSPAAWSIGPVISEIQSEWVISTMIHMREQGYVRIEPKLDAERAWAKSTNDACNKTLLPYNKTTWYMGGNIPGKPREALNYVGGLPSYQAALDECFSNGWSDFVLQ